MRAISSLLLVLLPLTLPAQQSLKDNPSAYVRAGDINPPKKHTTTGLSLRDVMGTIGDTPMQTAPAVGGVQRVMGKSRDGRRTLEVIGDPADVSSVTLVAVHAFAPSQAWEEIEPLVRNCTPGVGENYRDAWLKKSVAAVMRGGKPQHWTPGQRKVTVKYLKPMRALMVTVTPGD